MSQEPSYPKRPQFYAMRFHRVMAKVVMAQEFGPLGYGLLSVIACQEDVCRYRRAVTFYDVILMQLLGTNSRSTLISLRKRLVAAGWLHYEPGRKGVPSRYWVLIPKEHSGIDDSPMVEDSEIFCPNNEQHSENAVQNMDSNATESRQQSDRIRSITYPIPIPNPYPTNSANSNSLLQKNEADQISLNESTDKKEENSASDDLQKEAVGLAQQFHFKVPGLKRPQLEDLVDHFHAKLQAIQANKPTDFDSLVKSIHQHIHDPKRDRTKVDTIAKMFMFWQDCGIDQKPSNERNSHARSRRNPNTSPGGGRHQPTINVPTLGPTL